MLEGKKQEKVEKYEKKMKECFGFWCV